MPQILITIDTEIGELTEDRPDAFEIFIEGKVGGKEVGYKFIMDILDKYNIKGEFFTDVYPYKIMGEEKFAKLCQNIFQRGHGVQLHTHPSTAFDTSRKYMYQYSLSEQLDILKLGREKIKEWAGKYPVAHRAGGYGANTDTFEALKQTGMRYDSSYLYGNENCKLKNDFKNKIFEINGILEVPVTVFFKIINYKFLGINISSKKYFQKLDIRYGAELEEIKKVISQSAKNNILVLFLHSFNFLSLPYNFNTKKYGKISIDKDIIDNFQELLDWITKQKECIFCNFEKLEPDFFAKDNIVEISSRGNITPKLYDKFNYKIFKNRLI